MQSRFGGFGVVKIKKIFVQPLDVIEMNLDDPSVWAHIVLHMSAAISGGRLFGGVQGI